jgi:putative flippase GtrA
MNDVDGEVSRLADRTYPGASMARYLTETWTGADDGGLGRRPTAMIGLMRRSVSTEFGSFVAIGLLCTAAYAALYTLLRDVPLSATAANALALTATMGVNFAANRRYTFNATDGPLRRQLLGYAAAYSLGLIASSLTLGALLNALGHPHGVEDTAAALTAGLAATLVRYVLMRGWVFRSPAAQRS